jgi:ABC-type lipoprotein export system ATPase subunit
MPSPLLEVSSLEKEYRQPDGRLIRALSLDSLQAREGEALAITGPSGSGKTTLLRLLAALSQPSHGNIRFNGQDLRSFGSSGSRWRAASVGYVFQNMNLLPDFSLLENLILAAEISNMSHGIASERALSLLCRLGIEDRMYHRPSHLSLGEQQRGAVARAVMHCPPLVLADEPTASLDAENAFAVVDLLVELCAESRTLLLVASHDETVTARFSRVVRLQKAASNLGRT